MVDIQTFSIAIASAGVFLAAVYYIIQIRHQTKMRQTDLVMRLYSQYSSPEFQKIWERVLTSKAKDFADYTGKYGWAEALTVGMFFEGIAILLEGKLIDMALVHKMFSTTIKITWEKMKGITLEARKVRNEPTIFAWFEYLYNEVRKCEQTQQAGVKNG